MDKYDVISVGLGPAACSAAIYTAMGGYKTLMVGQAAGALYKAEKIGNFYGQGVVEGKRLFEEGLARARAVGAEVLYGQVVEITFGEACFNVKSDVGEYAAKAVLIATGAARNRPKLGGLGLFDGRGVSWCAVCDGFFYRKKKVGVYGAGRYAFSEAAYLAGIGCDVTVFTDGREPEEEGVKAEKRKIKTLFGDELLGGAELEDGEKVPLSAMFIAEGVASSADFAKMIGLETEGDRIKINAKCETNCRGIYAAGDCTGGLLQVAKAAGEGAVAGVEICKYLKTL